MKMSFPFRMVKILLTFILFITISFAKDKKNGLEGISSENSSLKAEALKIDSPPLLDGEVLSDPIWYGARPISDFWQTAPYEGERSSEKTEVYIAYTGNALYFGVVCYDRDPSGIIVSSSRRDASLRETDSFQILLDTYFDRQNGFLFGTNPIGIEYDAQITNEGMGQFGSGGGGFNLDWDGSWKVKTKISEIGWSAEFAIPFKTLRYSEQKQQVWGLNLQRNIRRKNENAYWVKLPRQFDIQKISLAGSLEGLLNLSQRNLKIIPYTLGKLNRDFENQSEFDRASNFGLDLKYGMTPSLTLDATYNTDFAQVEADEFQINLDRFNLRFPEKRGFFLENAGYFGLGDPGEVELFFSRRIGISDDREVPILGGARVSGKVAGLNIGLLNMQTESVSADTIPGNNFSVARISQQLPNRSSIGGIFVNRSGTGNLSPRNDENRTFGMDGRLGIGKYWNLSGFAAATNTPALEGKEYAYKLAADYDSPFWLYSVSYTEVTEDFNPEVGFLSRSGYRKPAGRILYRWRPDDFLGFLELRPHASYQGYWNFDGSQESGHLHIDNHWEWKNGYEFHSGINFTQEGVREPFEIYPGVLIPVGNYQHKEAQLVFNTNQGAWWSFQIRSFIGGFFGGERVNVTPSFRFRLGETFNTSVSLSRNDIDLPYGNFITNLFSTQLSYSFTPKMYLQALFQVNDRDDIAGLNIRFGWLQTANSGLFLVYNDSRISEDRIFQISRYRTFIVKYSYMFDLL